MFEAALLSIVVVIFRGGFSKKSEFLLIKGWYLFIIGILVQRLPEIAGMVHLVDISHILEQNFIYVHLLSYGLILVSLVLNIRMHSIKIILTGTILNMAAIFSNSGFMPVSRKAIETFKTLELSAGSAQLDYKHVLIGPNTNFAFLTDILSTPKWYPFKNIISIGDIFIAVGIFFLIQKMFSIQDSSANQKKS